MWNWEKCRQIDQWNRRENSEIDPHIYKQPTLDKGKRINWREDNIFNKGRRTIGYSYANIEKLKKNFK